ANGSGKFCANKKAGSTSVGRALASGAVALCRMGGACSRCVRWHCGRRGKTLAKLSSPRRASVCAPEVTEECAGNGPGNVTIRNVEFRLTRYIRKFVFNCEHFFVYFGCDISGRQKIHRSPKGCGCRGRAG